MDSATISTAAEYATIMAVTGVATQFIKQLPAITKAWTPLISLVIGIIAGLASVAITHDSNWAAGALQGALAGMSMSGSVDLTKSAVTSVKTKLADNKQAKADEFDAAVAKAVEAKLAATPASDAAPTPAPADGGDSSAAQV